MTNGKQPIHPQGVVTRSRPIHDPGGNWVETGRTTPIHSGITKREYFSGLALQGLLACPDINTDENIVAASAVAFADALLRALAAGGEG